MAARDEPTHREVFLESLERCVASREFFASFYERFLATSEEVRAKFRNTDFERQNAMLLGSLRLAAGAADGQSAALRELRERAESHDRHHLDIQPRLYDLWLDSILDTARRSDGHWSETIERAWRIVLGHVINHLARHY